jgi:hypothetical protein
MWWRCCWRRDYTDMLIIGMHQETPCGVIEVVGSYVSQVPLDSARSAPDNTDQARHRTLQNKLYRWLST